jgi:hypothetical protein
VKKRKGTKREDKEIGRKEKRKLIEMERKRKEEKEEE